MTRECYNYFIKTEGLYLRYALEYFIVARGAYFKYFDISGNLFHHAIEMTLKSFLCLHLSEADLRDTFRHNLESLWKEIKKFKLPIKYSRFEKLISKLNNFEEIRYPPKNGFITEFGDGAMIDQPRSVPIQFKNVKSQIRKYALNINEVDELFYELLIAFDADPQYLKGWLNKDALALYSKDNKYKFL